MRTFLDSALFGRKCSRSRPGGGWLCQTLSVVPQEGGGGAAQQAGTTPQSPAPAAEGFAIRNWWRNGVACRVTFILAILSLFNLFEPWQPDYIGAGYSITRREGNDTVRSYFRGTESTGGGNAFTEGQGWIPFIGFLGTLFVCGKPRRSLGGLRWVPMWAAILIFACAVDAKREQQREREKWLSRFTTRPLVLEPPAQQWVIIFSLVMIISGACLARSQGRTPLPSPPPHPPSAA